MVFPLGLLQLYHSVEFGYFDARTLKSLSNPTNSLVEWLRFPGDVLFIIGGVLPLCAGTESDTTVRSGRTATLD